MIHVEQKPPPEGFDEHVRQPGRAWLEDEAHRRRARPRPFWNEWPPCREALRTAFHHRCGYLAMSIPSGHVDHFESWAQCKHTERYHLAYEWTNYRWLLPEINQRKQREPSTNLLDPYEVRDEWFELVLPSLELRLTNRVPAEIRQRAAYTIKRLKLDRGALAIEQRWAWVERYMEGLSLERLEQEAPLVGRALRMLMEAPRSRLREELAIFRQRILKRRDAVLRG
ncbi:MAG: hypothetical protein AAGF11_36525 [Myxococcota bacterium]